MISPCIKVCKIAPGTDICVGCFRTLTQIQKWVKLSDKQKLEIMKRINMTQERELLREIINWWDNDFGNGNLSVLIGKIRKHLENCNDQETAKTTKTAECPNPFCEGYSFQKQNS